MHMYTGGMHTCTHATIPDVDGQMKNAPALTKDLSIRLNTVEQLHM